MSEISELGEEKSARIVGLYANYAIYVFSKTKTGDITTTRRYPLSSPKELNITFSHSSFSVKRRILKSNSYPAGRETPFHGICTTVVVFTRTNYWTISLARSY
jgi:hypothetical protein